MGQFDAERIPDIQVGLHRVDEGYQLIGQRRHLQRKLAVRLGHRRNHGMNAWASSTLIRHGHLS